MILPRITQRAIETQADVSGSPQQTRKSMTEKVFGDRLEPESF